MIKIYYSHTPFWRAEVLRVSLYISDIPFKDIRITRDEFITMIKTGLLPNGKKVPFRQLPVIEVENKIIGRTTSGNYSFCFEKNLTFGYIDTENSIENLKKKNLFVEVEKKKYPISILSKPLIDKKIRTN